MPQPLKRIAIDCRMYESSGIGIFIQNVVPRVINDLPETEFVLLGDNDVLGRTALLERSNVSVIHYNAPIYSIKEQTSFPYGLLKGTDLFWATNYNIPLLWRGNLLVCVHDVAHLALPEVFTGILKRAYAKTMLGAVRRKADQIATCSNFSAEEFGKLVGTPREKIKVIYCGVSEAWFDLKGIASKSEHDPYFVYVGNVKPHKNLRGLLEAFSAICCTIPHKLKIIGKREGFLTGDDELPKLLGDLQDRVEFTGFIALEDLQSTVANADALVLPSLYEGFGIPPIEAMAAGTATLVSNVASLPEVCGGAALYCDPRNEKDMADKLRLVLTDRDLQNRLVAAGQKQARLYNWDDAAKQYVDLIKEIAASH